jgi:hypothetical protein
MTIQSSLDLGRGKSFKGGHTSPREPNVDRLALEIPFHKLPSTPFGSAWQSSQEPV